MERRTAIAFAAAAAGTVLTAGAAFTTNVGLLQHDKPTPISVLDSSQVVPESTQDPTVVTVVVDDPPVASDDGSTPSAVGPTSAASTVEGSDDDAVVGSGDDHEDEHELEPEVQSDDDD
jgi:hypothetical protein